MKICLEYRAMFSETQHLSPAANEQKLVRVYVCVCVCIHIHTHTHIYIYIYTQTQGVPGGMCQTLGECSYVKVNQYNPKHLYPKLNGYGDNGQRKVRSPCGSTCCTFSADALCVHCACPWDWNSVNIVPACPCKVLGTLRTTTALMRVFM